MTNKRIIYKYLTLPYFEINVPVGSSILNVGEQDGDIYMWVCVPIDETKMVVRNFFTKPTGHVFDDNIVKFIGTVQLKSGLVFHIFEGC
jgi:hypothetical protein